MESEFASLNSFLNAFGHFFSSGKTLRFVIGTSSNLNALRNQRELVVIVIV